MTPPASSARASYGGEVPARASYGGEVSIRGSAARAAEYNVQPAARKLVRRKTSRRRARGRKGYRRRRNRLWYAAFILLMAVATLLLGFLVLGTLVLFVTQLEDAPTATLATKNEPSIPVAAAMPTPVLGVRVLPTGGDSSATFDAAAPPPLLTLDDGREIALGDWDGRSRFTLLVAGIDRRPDEGGLAFRTDSMMLISIDPESERIGILSLPRDLYVHIPNYEEQRLNAALFFGETQWRGYGPTLLLQTVQANLGIRVRAYALLDFSAFIALVDAVGGIDVILEEAIDDPAYPDLYRGYDPFYLSAGAHHLDGEDALKFARTRHGGSDMQRSARQQQVLFALRERIQRLRLLPVLLARIPSLLASLRDSLYTNLDLDDMVSLAWYLKDFSAEDIETAVLRAPYVTDWVRPEDGQHVLVPDQLLMWQLMSQLFGPNYAN